MLQIDGYPINFFIGAIKGKDSVDSIPNYWFHCPRLFRGAQKAIVPNRVVQSHCQEV
jgi:hypothetical protein